MTVDPSRGVEVALGPGTEPSRATGFEHPDHAFEPVFTARVGPRFVPVGSEDGPGWRPADRPWATRAILAWIAVSMVAPFLIGVALGDLGLAVSLSLGGQIPFLTLGALILLWWGLVVERVREVEIRVDGQGIAVGADRWDWKDVKAVRGGGRALIEASGARKVYSGGLVLETVEGPVAWHVTGQDGDLDALVALLESTRLRASGTSDASLSRMVGRARVLE